MRIVHIITGLGLGGAETILYRLVSNTNNNDSVSVISLADDGFFAGPMRESGVDVYSLGMRRGRVTVGGVILLYRLLRRLHPDIVQTWMYHADFLGGLIARLAGIRAVVWGLRNSNLDPGKIKRGTRVVTRLCAFLSRWVPYRIVSCSTKAAEVHKCRGYSAEKLVVIPNGYDMSRYIRDENAGAAVRKELEIPDGVSVIGMVARFDPQKDHANLICALEELRERGASVVSLLIGSGITKDNPEVHKAIQEAGIEDSVFMLGARIDITSILNALDLKVLSSVSEGFPNVLAEAMACGTPCVTTDVGEAGLIVGETGWVVPSRNSKALADAIETALIERKDNSKAWRHRQKICRIRILEKFSLEKMVEAYSDLWAEVVAETGKGKKY